MRRFTVIITAMFSALSFTFVQTVLRATDCPQLVRAALEATQQFCERTERNQACYGHMVLEAQPQPGFGPLVFNQQGDLVDVSAVQSLRLSAMDVDNGLWGVALMRLRADLPATQTDDVTFLLYGDVKIDNAVETPVKIDVSVSVNTYVNVRRGPHIQLSPVGTLAPKQTVKAIGRLADNSWLRVELPDSGVTGWVFGQMLTSQEDINQLKVMDASMPVYGPMQAFYFESGKTEPSCAEAPANGLLIQTPEGIARVTLLMNEVNIQIDGTAFVQAQPGEEMTINVVEGWVSVEVSGEAQTAIAGSEVSIPLTGGLSPAATPHEPEPYRLETMQRLRLGQLARNVEIPDPLTVEEIQKLKNEQKNGSGRGHDEDAAIDPNDANAPHGNAPDHSNAGGNGQGQGKDKDKPNNPNSNAGGNNNNNAGGGGNGGGSGSDNAGGGGDGKGKDKDKGNAGADVAADPDSGIGGAPADNGNGNNKDKDKDKDKKDK